MIQTTRIDLGDGAWADLATSLLRRTGSAIEQEMRRHMTPVGGESKVLFSEVEDKGIPKPDYTIDVASINDTVLNELYIMGQVTAWSFGLVNRDVLMNEVGQVQYIKLVQEMTRLYQPIPFPNATPRAKGLVNKSSWLSKLGAFFRSKPSTPTT